MGRAFHMGRLGPFATRVALAGQDVRLASGPASRFVVRRVSEPRPCREVMGLGLMPVADSGRSRPAEFAVRPDAAAPTRQLGPAGSPRQTSRGGVPVPDGAGWEWTNQAGESSIARAGARFGFRAIAGGRTGRSRRPQMVGNASLRNPPALPVGAVTCWMSTLSGGRSRRSIQWGQLRSCPADGSDGGLPLGQRNGPSTGSGSSPCGRDSPSCRRSARPLDRTWLVGAGAFSVAWMRW